MSKDILKRLDEYALEYLDEDGYQLLMKNKTSKNQIKKGTQQDGKPRMSARQKKKLRKINRHSQDLIPEDKVRLSDNNVVQVPSRKSYREKIIEEMGLNLHPEKVENSQPTFLSVNKEGGPEVIVFYDAAKKRKLPKKDYSKISTLSQEVEDFRTDEKQPEFNFKKARYEVLKFGISGFEKVKKEEAKIALAIKLGATPPKRQYMNYRQLMEMKKQQKLDDKVEREMNRKMGVKLKPIARPQKQRNQNAVAGFDSQVGKYRDGVQFVKKNDLKFHAKRKK